MHFALIFLILECFLTASFSSNSKTFGAYTYLPEKKNERKKTEILDWLASDFLIIRGSRQTRSTLTERNLTITCFSEEIFNYASQEGMHYIFILPMWVRV